MALTYDLALTDGGAMLTALPVGLKVCTGAYAAAQRFAAVLLTSVGSRIYDPLAGTELIPALEAGVIRVDADVGMYFNQAAADAIYQLSQLQDGTETDEEVLVAANLDGFELVPPDLNLRVTLTTRAGTAVSMTLPLTVSEVNHVD